MPLPGGKQTALESEVSSPAPTPSPGLSVFTDSPGSSQHLIFSSKDSPYFLSPGLFISR